MLPDLPANLRDIRRLNLWFGAVHTVRQLCAPHLGQCESVLDVATGSADIPVALYDWASRRRHSLHITALDLSPEILLLARSIIGRRPIHLLQGNALHLPFPDRSYDLVMCNLALHHFDESSAVVVLAEMHRVARRVLIVLDLERSAVGYAGVWLATQTVARARLTRHDGPLSVLRAFTPAELTSLAVTAQVPAPQVRRHPFFRISLVAPLEHAHG